MPPTAERASTRPVTALWAQHARKRPYRTSGGVLALLRTSLPLVVKHPAGCAAREVGRSPPSEPSIVQHARATVLLTCCRISNIIISNHGRTIESSGHFQSQREANHNRPSELDPC